MAKKIVQPVEVQASVSGDQSVKSFKAQIREAQQEALRLAAAFGETDKRTIAAAQKVAHLRDRMEDVNATIKGLHPDKFQMIANITGTLANGFAAAQGAAALLGGESEDLQKAMVRVQGAMALAQGVSGLKDMQFMFAGLQTTITTQVIPALGTLRGALIATGVGAIVVAVGLLAANWEKVTGAVRRFFNLPDWGKIKKQNEHNIKTLEREIELLEAKGATEEEIHRAKLARYQQELLQLIAIDSSRQLTEEETARMEELRHLARLEREREKFRVKEKTIKDTEKAETDAEERRKKREELTLEAEQKRLQAEQNSIERNVAMLKLHEDTLDNRLAITQLNFEKEIRTLKEKGYSEVQIQMLLNAELNKVRATYYKEQEDAQKKQQDTLKAQREKAAQDELSFIQSKYDEEELAAMKAAKTQEDLQKAQTEIRKRELQNEIQARRDAGLATVEQEKELEALRLKNAEDAANKQKEIDKAVADIKKQAYADVMTASSALIELIGQQTVAGKAIALAQIAADTGVAIAKALNTTSSPSPDNVATGGLAGIAKYAAISAAILSASARAVKIVKSNGNQQPGGGSSGLGASRVNVPMPSMNSSSLGGGTQQAGQWSNKVYVTEGDISATQRRTRNLRKTSVL
ncbi:MAG: hypothetical protein EBR82_57790 [Caulobacteraceae bacterium]|nr:hypothetical protein [Caulobacteraceae bacterium]